MSSIGPSGAISGAQTYSPGLSVATIWTTEPELTSTCWACAVLSAGKTRAMKRAGKLAFIVASILILLAGVLTENYLFEWSTNQATSLA